MGTNNDIKDAPKDETSKVPDPAKVEKFLKSKDRYVVKKTDEKA